MNVPAMPIHFAEVFKTKVWGGRRLETLLGKSLSEGEPVGESWEVSDHPHGMSVVDAGPLSGKTLREMVEADEAALIGREGALEAGGRFPLLFKFIDAARWLSVQVHPTDDYARRFESGDPGKTEAWYVIAAEPGAKIARGLKPGTSRDDVRHGIETDTLEHLLRFVNVSPGDVVAIPSGTVHALGPGVVVAEIQQNSDTTYRLYDWGRVGLDGKPRELHVDKGLAVSDFSDGGDPLKRPHVLVQANPRHERLVANDKFTFERFMSSRDFDISAGAMRSFVILACTHGRATLQFPLGERSIRRGETLLLPAVLEEVHLAPDPSVELLAMSLPVKGDTP